MKICASDICKIIFGSCTSEKVVAKTGGGANYCTGSPDTTSPKDNYADPVGGTDKVTNCVKEHRKEKGKDSKTETEACNPDESW